MQSSIIKMYGMIMGDFEIRFVIKPNSKSDTGNFTPKFDPVPDLFPKIST